MDSKEMVQQLIYKGQLPVIYLSIWLDCFAIYMYYCYHYNIKINFETVEDENNNAKADFDELEHVFTS